MKVPYNKSPDSSHITAAWYERYFATQPEDCENVGYTNSPDSDLDLYIISFNQPKFIEYQIKLLDASSMWCNIIVVDNNCGMHMESSQKVREICEREQVIYLKAPDNHYQLPQFFDPSLKLGCTMNWLYYNVIKKRKPDYFGFLDHDCFLIDREFDVIDYLDNFGMYGTICTNGEKWNLHVITNFFKSSFVEGMALDFRPSWANNLDTGGANWNALYSQRNKETYRLNHIGVRYSEEDVVRKDGVQHYEIIDDSWVHFCASSHDQLYGDNQRKMDYICGYLDALTGKR